MITHKFKISHTYPILKFLNMQQSKQKGKQNPKQIIASTEEDAAIKKFKAVPKQTCIAIEGDAVAKKTKQNPKQILIATEED